MESRTAIVVPLFPLDNEPSNEVMLRMLLNREALLISRVEAPNGDLPSGMVAQASGAFATAISRAVGQAGRLTPSEGL